MGPANFSLLLISLLRIGDNKMLSITVVDYGKWLALDSG